MTINNCGCGGSDVSRGQLKETGEEQPDGRVTITSTAGGYLQCIDEGAIPFAGRRWLDTGDSWIVVADDNIRQGWVIGVDDLWHAQHMMLMANLRGNEQGSTNGPLHVAFTMQQ